MILICKHCGVGYEADDEFEDLCEECEEKQNGSIFNDDWMIPRDMEAQG